MDRLISDIETYCVGAGLSPERLLRTVLNAKWGQWQEWKSRKASPTVATADKLYDWMKSNPPRPAKPAEDAA